MERSDREPRVSTSSVSCRLRLTSSDGRFTGTVSVLLVGNSDPAFQARELKLGDCYGQAGPVPVGNRHDESKQCVEFIGGDVAYATVFATRGARYAHVVADIEGACATREDVVTFARDTAHRITGRALTLSADG